MRRALLGAVATVSLVVGGLSLGSGPGAAADDDPVTILVNGDSLTRQYDGDFTWRYRLVREIQRQGVRADFVGPQKWATGGERYYRVQGWDSDHGAIGATRVWDWLSYGRAKPPLADTVAALQPDLLVSYLGYNDLADAMVAIAEEEPAPSEVPGLVQQWVATILDRYETLLTGVRAAAPEVKIVLGEVNSHRIEAGVRAYYNQQLRERIVDDPAYAPIAVAALDDGMSGRTGTWGSTRYTFDQIHPTPTGELWIAQRFAQAIHQIAPEVLPQAPAIPQVHVPWNPVISLNLRVSARKLYVNWSTSKSRNTILGMRVKFVNVRTRKVAVGAYVNKPNWISGKLRPGYTYRVRAQGIRGEMTTPWTKAYTIKVPKAKKKRR